MQAIVPHIQTLTLEDLSWLATSFTRSTATLSLS